MLSWRGAGPDINAHMQHVRKEVLVYSNRMLPSFMPSAHCPPPIPEALKKERFSIFSPVPSCCTVLFTRQIWADIICGCHSIRQLLHYPGSSTAAQNENKEQRHQYCCSSCSPSPPPPPLFSVLSFPSSPPACQAFLLLNTRPVFLALDTPLHDTSFWMYLKTLKPPEATAAR